MRFILIAAALALLGCKEPAPVAPPDPLANPGALGPQDHVRLDSMALACAIRSEAVQAYEHRLRGEISLLTELVNSPGCFRGDMLKPGQEWTVLAVDAPYMLVGQITGPQQDTDPARSHLKYWTRTQWGHNPSP